MQVALQYEIDAREKPDNFSTGYIPQGSFAPDQYPLSIYGTEVFEVNDALRQIAIGFTSNPNKPVLSTLILRPLLPEPTPPVHPS